MNCSEPTIFLIASIKPIFDSFSDDSLQELLNLKDRFFKSKKTYHVNSGYSFNIFMTDINSFVQKKCKVEQDLEEWERICEEMK